jgi:hypothetical protein
MTSSVVALRRRRGPRPAAIAAVAVDAEQPCPPRGQRGAVARHRGRRPARRHRPKRRASVAAIRLPASPATCSACVGQEAAGSIRRLARRFATERPSDERFRRVRVTGRRRSDRVVRNGKAIALVAASGRSIQTRRGWRIEVRPQAALRVSPHSAHALKHLLLAREGIKTAGTKPRGVRNAAPRHRGRARMCYHPGSHLPIRRISFAGSL